jgi:glucose-6-phosphate isomerase
VLVSDPTPGQADALLATAGDHLRFTMPAEVGGRYSVLTAVGQVPLRAAGLPPHALLLGARTEAARLAERGDPVVEWSSWRAAHPADAMVLWSYAHPVAELAAWWQQLECESLGKTRPDGRRTGELVTLLRGPADQHSVAQLLLEGATSCRVVVLDLAAEPAPAALREVSRLRSTERDATFDAMVRPSARLLVIDRTLETLGAAMLQLMFATVAWADHLGVDPYGQPAVEAIKKRVVARRGGASG